MNFFADISQAPIDPVLGLNQLFAEDSRPFKVNLGVGSYKTADLKPYVLNSVQKAEAILLEKKLNKEYLPIDGEKEFLTEMKKLILGDCIPHDHVFALQGVGGTGALRVGGEFLVEHIGKSFFISSPTWDNHKRIFERAGGTISTYPYYDKKNKNLDFPGLCHAVKQMPPKSILVLQGCCHNPTGFDPSEEQWKELCELVKQRVVFPFFDFAYQGFGDNLEKDAWGIRYFISQGVQCLIASSYSKNFGLYAERIGALLLVCSSREEALKVGSQVKQLARGLYSNPPCHGARIISTILQEAKLRSEWELELLSMRERISEMRRMLAQTLSALSPSGVFFEGILKQKGMFSYTGLRGKSVERMTQEFGIYLLKEGRINVAGINNGNVDYVAKAMIAVLPDNDSL